MNPLQRELRWERVWNITTLDIARTLSQELCVPVSFERVKAELRSILEAHYERNEYGVVPGLLHSEAANVLKKIASGEEFIWFAIWAERILSSEWS